MTESQELVSDEHDHHERHLCRTRRRAVGPTTTSAADVVFDLDDLAVYYGKFRAVRDVDLKIRANEITAFIGPSGCGKTTVLRCFNRMNDLIAGARVEGTVTYHGVDLYGAEVSATRGAPPDRHGVPEAEPVPEVHLRQRRLRAAAGRRQASATSSTRSSRSRCAARRCGTR